MRHTETDYKRVFIRDATCSPSLLNQRLRELVEICDTAEPVIELIEKGVTNVQHLINKARGNRPGNETDPSQAHAQATHGANMYQPMLTDEDVIDLQSRDD